LPLGKARLDPLTVPSVSLMDLVDRDGTGLSQKPRQYLATGNRRVDNAVSQHIRNCSFSRLFAQVAAGFHRSELRNTKRRDVARKGLGENQAPVAGALRSELNSNNPPRLEQLAEGISAPSFFFGRDTRLQFLRSQVAGAIQQMGELVFRTSTPADCGTASLGKSLLDCFSCDVIATFAAHHFVQQRSIDGQQRRPLFCARCVITVQPVHHEAELQARRERRRYVRMHSVDANVARGDLSQNFLESPHVERILQHLAVRLDKNRKARELTHDLKQVEWLQSLEPQWHSPPWIPSWKQQRACCIHSETRT